MKKVLYLGWLGKGNWGDEVLFQTFKKYVLAHPELAGPIDIEAFAPFSAAKVAIEDCDLVVLGGGSLFHLTFWIRHCEEALKKNIPIVSYGTGIDGVFNCSVDEYRKHQTAEANSAELMQSVLKKFNFISCRGPYAEHFLKRLGAENISVIGDPALHYLEPQATRPKSKLVLLNFGHSHGDILGNQEVVGPLLAQIARELLSAGYQVGILPIWVDDIGDCLTLAGRLPPEVLRFERLPPLSEFMELLQRAALCVSFKLHPGILSLCVDTPAFFMAYRAKCFDFAATYSWDEFTCGTDVITIEKLRKGVHHLLAHGKDEIERRAPIKNALRAAHQAAIDRIVSEINAA